MEALALMKLVFLGVCAVPAAVLVYRMVRPSGGFGY